MRFALWKVVANLVKILLDFGGLLTTNIKFDEDAFDKTCLSWLCYMMTKSK
jgi:hypothetical protein